MPFVDQDHRNNLDPAISGDRCYVNYVEIMGEWRDSPRWTTVDTMMQQLISFLGNEGVSIENKAAALLAFMVFFNLHVMEYEQKKREEHGDI